MDIAVGKRVGVLDVRMDGDSILNGSRLQNLLDFLNQRQRSSRRLTCLSAERCDALAGRAWRLESLLTCFIYLPEEIFHESTSKPLFIRIRFSEVFPLTLRFLLSNLILD